jgi:transposase InsO family protein
VLIQVGNAEGLNVFQMEALLASSEGVSFEGQGRSGIYAWVQKVLVQQEYQRQGKKQRGTIRAFVAKMTGLSIPQITRLIRKYRETGEVKAGGYRRRQFARVYTREDVTRLTEVDRAHELLSGPATRRILQREWKEFHKPEYERLAKISVAHIYNIRKRSDYLKQCSTRERTRPVSVSIAERRRPTPQGRPGYLRVDTVHQGDWDQRKGVYHINSVDAVTQWEVVGCTPKITERFLVPVLEAMLEQYPFPILGFHADNGSEFINHTVAKLLEKLLVEFTKSRASRSTDNALVEGKNGAIIRKHIGYGHIGGEHAQDIQEFYIRYLNPYLNYHRPCGFATVSLDARGKRRRRYPAGDYATPYEKLKAISEGQAFLKAGIGWETLEQIAQSASDTEWARQMRRAKARLLAKCKIESPVPPRWEVEK